MTDFREKRTHTHMHGGALQHPSAAIKDAGRRGGRVG